MRDKRKAVLFDVDGTLCDVSRIRHLVLGSAKDFHRFHEESVNCPPHAHVVAASLALPSDVACIVITARKERYRRLTSFWLALHGVPSDELHMRPDYDSRPDVDIKREILGSVRQRYQILHAWDDNPHVIQMWEEEGIPVTVIPGWIDA